MAPPDRPDFLAFSASLTPGGVTTAGCLLPRPSFGDFAVYHSVKNKNRLKPLVPGERDPALEHRGSKENLLTEHQRYVEDAYQRRGVEGLRELDDVLLRRLADERTLKAAADYLRGHGGQAPGNNGTRLSDLNDGELWSLCRALSASILNGTYRPGEDRVVRIPKPGKPDRIRILTLSDVEDRIIGRAILLIIGPILEFIYSPFSFGFRKGQSTFNALSTAVSFAESQGRWFWIGDDIADAFCSIPHARLLDVCSGWFPADVVRFIELVSNTGNPRGIRQGASDSPMYANLYFDTVLDRPWLKAYPDIPLLRYADDLAVLCKTREEAESAYAKLSQLARSAGVPLKGTAQTAIKSLKGGESLPWLGFLIRREKDKVAIRIAAAAWSRLNHDLAATHLDPGAPISAVQVIHGWLSYLGPCLSFESHHEVIERVKAIAATHGFEEIPDDRELNLTWSAAHARWHRLHADQVAKISTTFVSHDSLPSEF
jgi:hypothetical protein